MLHIHNGDCSANIARRSSLPGEHFAWRESLITGPTPAGLSADDWRKLRAQHLSETYGVDLQECERGLLSQEEKLKTISDHEEVVLWFEHDLFCQVHLLYLLDWFAVQTPGTTKLSLTCINQFPGKQNFHGLGELTSDEFASLFPTRAEVTAQQLQLAQVAWQAYGSPAPTDLEKVLQTDTSALPFLDAALSAHLQRFPNSNNGLGCIENRSLQLIAVGANGFSDLFLKFREAEPVYGLGDAQFWLALWQMINAREPLLEIEDIPKDTLIERMLTPAIVQKAKFRLTAAGESVLRNEADFVTLNGIDLWLGGVHLSGKTNIWRWDHETTSLNVK
ncbi:MAG TPA: hypothetical protein VGW76_16140 [Pyrinomonadaceae bacterium]|nr:hypothetical protein [Pyrinomonadaceae bacterium]